MAIEMPYLSHSRIENYDSCKRAFYKKYIAKEDEENETVTFYASYGKLIHGILEKWYESHGFIGKTTALNMFHNGYDLDGERIKGFADVGVPDTYNKKYDMSNSDLYYQQGLRIIDQLHTRDTSKTVGTEVEFNFSIHPDVPNLYGFIDRIDKDERGYFVTDYKSSVPYSQKDADKKPQMTIYAMAVKELYGEYPYEFRYEHFRFGEIVRTRRTLEQIEQHKQELIRKWFEIQRTQQFEPTFDYFRCKTFCGYSASCELYKTKMTRKG